ncbi:hypothetical protein [Yoonia sp.]|uniref:hypothetical protein n=1 Tax=Yoonia sp. TaxID=2212373 RepID=UPI00397699CA
MPINRLVFIIAIVIALAAATIAVVLALFGSVKPAPMAGLAILSVIALCASFAWRWYSDRQRDKTAGK